MEFNTTTDVRRLLAEENRVVAETKGSRRDFLGKIGLAAGSALITAAHPKTLSATSEDLQIACNQYTWQEYYRREGRDFMSNLSHGFGEVAKAGIKGFEPNADSPEQISRVGKALQDQGLAMRSLYVNSWLHEEEKVDSSIQQILAIAKEAQGLGTVIIVTNPSPIRWGGPENKNDGQLETQARALNRLGGSLAELGIKLAYHNHDIELREAAREFHHMMVGTDSEFVHFCLDTHWVYRGSGNSQVALFDVIKLYGSRVIELHFRQSRDGIWTEAFGEGDIDYRRVASQLKEIGVRPHLVLEQAVEKGTPKTINPLEAHRQSIAYAREVFGGLLS